MFPRVLKGELAVRDKYEIGSFKEVFLSPFYWRLFDCLEKKTPPRIVVDLGGHCGHFPILCDLVIENRFKHSDAHYYIFEGQKSLIANIERNLAKTGLSDRCTIIHGLVGKRSGLGKIFIPKKSRLTASVHFNGSANEGKVNEVPYVDIEKILGDSDTKIDVLKLDIEGSEYEVFDTYPDLLKRTQIVLGEFHSHGGKLDALYQIIQDAGFQLNGPKIVKGNDELALLVRG